MNRKQRRQQAQLQSRQAAAPGPQAASNATAAVAALSAAVRQLHAGKLQESEALCKRVLEARPDHHAALHLLGVVMHRLGRKETAVELIGKAVALKPDYAEAHNGLGNVLAEMGRLEEAAAAYRMTVAIQPGYAEAHCNLGATLSEMGRLKGAAAALEKAVALKPDLAQAHNNLGIVLHKQGRLADAVASYRRAIAIKPDLAEAHNNLGRALKGKVEVEASAASHQKAVALRPDFAEAHHNLGNTFRDLGMIAEAISAHRNAIALKPNFSEAHSSLLDCLHYMPGLTLADIFAEHRRWNAQHAAPLAGEIVPHTNVRDADRRIRVGFVSGSFSHHPVGYMITPALEARDGAAWELYAYSDGGRSDDLTERIRAATDAWREIGGMKDDVVAQLIRKDEIDILVDLTGHAQGNRLLVFARKPAPVQVKWAGCQFNTTGMDAMDYFLTDAVETPPGAEKWFSEEVIRLPDGYACYAPPAYAPEVGPLPAQGRGYATFGCFNKLAKVHGPLVAAWARLLNCLPRSRLILKTRSLGDPAVRERYHAMFEAHGVERGRVDLLARSSHPELLAYYNEIDIALDPFPYSGCLTTYEALWMGVPVVTLAGDTFAGRHSASHLHNVGLDDWVVETVEDYLAVSERWSRDVPALADLRAGLRGRMAASPLCDGARFARNLESAFRTMWRRWCISG